MAQAARTADHPSMLSIDRPGALLRQLGLDSVYLLLAMPMGILTFTVVVTGWSLALGLLITLIGIPIAMLTIYVSRWMAWVERRRAALVLGEPIRGVYKPPSTGRIIDRLKALFSDPSTWKDLAWHLLLLPVGIVDFVVVVTGWSVSLGLLTMPAWWWALPDNDPTELGIFQVDSWGHAWLAAAIGLVALPLAAALVRGTAAASGSLSQLVLGPSRRQLEERVEVLAQTRAGAVDAAAAELQRIERDLHDGAQARLVALALDLGMARGPLRSRSRGGARARREGARRGQARDGRAARPRARHPPGAACRARPRRGDRRARRAHAAADADRGRPRPAPARAGRVRRLLHRRRGADQRGQARPGAQRQGAPAGATTAGCASRCATTATAAPTRQATASTDCTSASTALDGTLAIASPRGGPTVLYAEVPCAS